MISLFLFRMLLELPLKYINMNTFNRVLKYTYGFYELKYEIDLKTRAKYD